MKKIDEKRNKIVTGLKEKSLAVIDRELELLAKLGFEYKLRKITSTPTGKGKVQDTPCSYCGFKTDPPHDGRAHRNQDPKGRFTAKELKKLNLVKVEDD